MKWKRSNPFAVCFPIGTTLKYGWQVICMREFKEKLKQEMKGSPYEVEGGNFEMKENCDMCGVVAKHPRIIANIKHNGSDRDTISVKGN